MLFEEWVPNKLNFFSKNKSASAAIAPLNDCICTYKGSVVACRGRNNPQCKSNSFLQKWPFTHIAEGPYTQLKPLQFCYEIAVKIVSHIDAVVKKW